MRAESGGALVEYSLIAAPFFFLIFGIVETMFTYFGTVQLENGLETVARRVRTGEVQASGLTAAQFKNMLCAEVAPLIQCNGNLYVDARVYNQFASANPVNPLKPDGTVNPTFQFDTGNSGSIVLVSAFYVWHLNFPDVGLKLSNMAGSDRLLTATQVFRNEPWK